MNTDLMIASRHLGVTAADRLAMQRDALEASFATADVRRSVGAELDAVSADVR